MIDRLREKQMTLSSLEEIIDEFDFLNDSEDQIEYLIDLGLDLPAIDESVKTEQYRVHGCQSNVWMDINFIGSPALMLIKAESDAMIVNGLVALLMAIFNGKPANEALEISVRQVFDRLGLDRHLSPQRKNGLNGMVQRIQAAARLQLQDEADV